MAAALEILLQDWRERLRAWSADGSLASAARHALELGADDPPLLTQLTSQWTEGDFSALPPIVLLPASSMPGAAGAYAISTGTIYINQDWLETASREWVMAVLTEELGHHLDKTLNSRDTDGDEGKSFAKRLLDINGDIIGRSSSPDLGNITIAGEEVKSEYSATISYRLFGDKSQNHTSVVRLLDNRVLLGVDNSIRIYSTDGIEIQNITLPGRPNKIETLGDRLVVFTNSSIQLLDWSESQGYLISKSININGLSFQGGCTLQVNGEFFIFTTEYDQALGSVMRKYDLNGTLIKEIPFELIKLIQAGQLILGLGEGEVENDIFTRKVYSIDTQLSYTATTVLATSDVQKYVADRLVDACVDNIGNIYIATSQTIRKYDSTWKLLWTSAAPGEIQKISFINNEFLCVAGRIWEGSDGYTATGGSRSGFIQYLNPLTGGNASSISKLTNPGGNSYYFDVYSIDGNKDTIYAAGISYSGTPDGGIPEIGNGDVLLSIIKPVLNIENKPLIRLSALSPNISEDGAVTAIYQFTRTGDLTRDITVGFEIGGTAIEGKDYILDRIAYPANNAKMAAGISDIQIIFKTIANSKVESNKTISVSLLPSIDYGIESLESELSTIVNDDETIDLSKDVKINNAGAYMSQIGSADSFDSKVVLSWSTQTGASGSRVIYKRIIDVVNNTASFEAQVNTTPLEYQSSSPQTFTFDDGKFLIAWTSSKSTYARFYGFDYKELSENDIAIGDLSGQLIGISRVGQDLYRGSWLASINGSTKIVTREFSSSGNLREYRDTDIVFDTISAAGFYQFNDDRYLAIWPEGSQMRGRTFNVQDLSSKPDVELAIPVGTYIGGYKVAVLKNGDIVIAWNMPSDGTGQNVYAQIYDSSLSVKKSAFKLNKFEDATQQVSSIRALSDGGWVVAWSNAYGGPPLQYQKFSPDGYRIGEELGVATSSVDFTKSYGYLQSEIVEANGSLVLAWVRGNGGRTESSIHAIDIENSSWNGSIISLTLLESSIAEDGVADLTYVFNRTGSNASDLTVNYSVGGTATLGSDYAFVGQAGTTSSRSITFSSGSSTATVVVHPTADTTIEANETVALTLAAGTGYSIGTTGAVVGTITNDDFPRIILAVSPASASVTEDGIANLIYTFTRTGPTTSALTVNYTVGGTATLGTDYTGIAATPATKTVTFAAGSATATVTVDPTADTTVESDETVTLTLAEGSGYTVGTTTAMVGTIINDDVANRAPTALALSASSFNENIAAGIAVTTLSSTDPDSGDSFTYALVAGTGDSDNSAFSIDGNQLKIKASPDFESKSTYSIRMETRDSGGLTFEKAFTLSVVDVDEHPIIRGNSLYTIVDGPSWTQAEANAVKLGGHLVTVNDYGEDYFLWETTSELPSPYGDPTTHFWIGLTDQSEEGIWEWISGEVSTYRNWNGEPNDAHGGQDYAWNNWGGFGWDDAGGPGSSWELADGIAEIPFIRRGDSAYVIVEGPTWEEAETNANALGGHLVTINDAEENEWLHSAFLISGNNHNQLFWTGLTDRETEGDWKWVSGEDVSYLNWGSNEGVLEPNGGIDSPYMLLGRYPFKWNDAPSTQGGIAGGIAEIRLARNNSPTGRPIISGTLELGSTINIDISSLKDADNGSYWTPTYYYFWESSSDGLEWDVINTPDASDLNDNLEITEDLTGKLIRGVVRYFDGYGTNEVVNSDAATVETILPKQRVISLPTDLTAKVGQVIEIPIAINQAQDLQAFDLTFAFDPTLFSLPSTGDLIRGGSLTQGWTVTGNVLASNTAIKISGFAATSLSSAAGELAYLRLQVNGDAPRGEALLDLVNVSLNEEGIQADLQDGSITITAPKVSIASDLKAPVGGSIEIPISIDDATDLQSIDLVFAYDPEVFTIPSTGAVVAGGDLTSTWSFTANTNIPGEIKISGSGTTPLSSVDGDLINLNLKVNSGIETGTALLDLVSASFNEGAITADLIDGTLELLPPTFQVTDVRQIASGLALKLSEAPDLDTLNLYDGQDESVDLPDLRLTRSDGTAVEDLSLHWKEETSELYVLQTDSLTGINQAKFDAGVSPFQSDLLAPGDYNLVIDARNDGLISASSGELIDGNGDGITGDAFSYSFSKTAPDNAISIGDTTRGSGQTLGLNGIAESNGISGLPVLISTTGSITQLRGTVTYDAKIFSDVTLIDGRDLPDDWTIETQEDVLGSIAYNASGTTAITGTDQELFRFDSVVSQDAEYGSGTLIEATAEAPEDPNLTFTQDPSLVVLAYAGDTTGNGGERALSSLDASRIQRVVVGLDSGFDAYDTIAPTLIGDTTGNGGLSSLDASRIQQEVVGLPVDSFPGLPTSPLVDPIG